jgi:hypothetical protein
MEKIEKRLLAMEKAINPRHETTDLIGIVRKVREEQEKLMLLSEADYQAELQKPTDSTAILAARVGVENQKRFDSLSPEEQKRACGFPFLEQCEFEKMREAQSIKRCLSR